MEAQRVARQVAVEGGCAGVLWLKAQAWRVVLLRGRME